MSAAELIRIGRFDQALPLLERASPSDELNAVALAETLYERGAVSRAHSAAEALLRKTRNQSIASRSLRVLASCARDRAQHADTILLSQKSVEAAQASEDEGELAVATLALLECVCDRDGFSSSLPMAATARRLVRRVGDPQLTARLHITFGRLEGRAGHFDRALRHFELGHTMLALAQFLASGFG